MKRDGLSVLFPVDVFYPSQAGGMANANYWVAKNLARNGFSPVIISSDKGLNGKAALGRWLRSEAGRVKYIRTPRVHYPFRQSIAALAELRYADVVHVTSIFYPTAFLTAALAKLLRKKLVVSPQGELHPAALRHSAARKRPVLRLVKNALRTYPTFHATSEAEREHISAVFGESARVEVIPNYIELPRRIDAQPRDYLLFIGRLHPVKGIDNLIRALPMSTRFMESRLKLKIAGSGWGLDEARLKELAAGLRLGEKVEFVGQVEGEAKERLYAEARWTIVPSHSESFGIVVPESLAQGTPVIASQGTPWEILEKEKVGFWIGNDSESLASQIDSALALPDDVYAGYRERARPFVERKFDIEKNIGDWIDLYQSL